MNNKVLQNFKFARFRFYLEAKEKIYLPRYEGSTLRGGFGSVFKRIVCINKEGNCERCTLKEKCIYSYIFETVSSNRTKSSYSTSKYSHPFIIEPLTKGKCEYNQDDKLTFNLILIGKAIDYLPYFTFAYSELGRKGIGRNRGRYTLEKVDSILDKNMDEIKTVYTRESDSLLGNYQIQSFTEIAKKSGYEKWENITLQFLTPTRIKYKGRLILDVNFDILVKNLFRRISLLSEIHCGEKFDFNFKRALDEAKNIKVIQKDLYWSDWERYSSRQKRRMKLGGFKGKVIFEGNLDKFISFIKLGEYIHIGKGTSFGLGKYKILFPI